MISSNVADDEEDEDDEDEDVDEDVDDEDDAVDDTRTTTFSAFGWFEYVSVGVVLDVLEGRT